MRVRLLLAPVLVVGLVACVTAPSTGAGGERAAAGGPGTSSAREPVPAQRIALDTPLPPDATLSSPRRWHIAFRYRLRNEGPGTAMGLELAAAIPPDRANQRVANLHVSRPYDLRTDRYGQRVAWFEVQELPPGQELQIAYEADVELSTVAFDLDPVKTGGLDAIPEDVARLYGGNEDVLRLDSPVIRRAAREAAGAATNPYWIARNVNDYLIDRLSYENDHTWSDAESTWQNRKGSCTEYSFLFIALCRANGLPARYVSATFCKGGVEGPFTDTVFHRWAEVYLPPYGWVPVDATYDDTQNLGPHAFFGSTNNRHFATAIGGGSSEYLGIDTVRWTYHRYRGDKPRLKGARSFTWTPLP